MEPQTKLKEEDELKEVGVIMRTIFTKDPGRGLSVEELGSEIRKGAFKYSDETIGKMVERLYLAGLLDKLEQTEPKTGRITWSTIFGRSSCLPL